MAGNGDRTEKPTGKRLQDARKKGRLPRSRSLGDVAGLAGSVLALSWTGGRMMRQLGVMLTEGLARLGDAPLRELQAGELTSLAAQGAEQIVVMVLPIAGAVAAAVVLTNALQGGWVFATDALQFKWSNLNPANGIKRLGLTVGGAEMVKTILAVIAIGFVAEKVVLTLVADAPRMGGMPALPATMLGWQQALSLLKQSIVVMGLIAAADYGLQRYRFLKSMKMTKQEVKDDMKQMEGSPETKGRIRRIQREMAKRRMLQATRNATVVITNPTHYAVALDYRRETMPAPRVVAKGRDLLAARIREIAREHGVPVVENRPLARALYDTAEVGDLIPGDLFEAVAEILAYLIRLKQLVL